MALPAFSVAHPLGTTNPVTVRASAALAGAGAWDATPTEFSVAGYRWITLYISYTRGAAGGAVDFQIQTSPYSVDQVGVESWFEGTLLAPAVLAAGVDSQSRIQREYITYAATGAAIENPDYGPIEFGASVERMRIRCRESGVVGTPGTLHIVGVLFT